MFSTSQRGFRSKHLIILYLSGITNGTTDVLNKGNNTSLIAPDYSKMFDTHQIASYNTN